MRALRDMDNETLVPPWCGEGAGVGGGGVVGAGFGEAVIATISDNSHVRTWNEAKRKERNREE